MQNAYLKKIRTNSCYPKFRVLVTAATVVLYILAAVPTLAAVAGVVNGGSIFIIFLGVVVTVIFVIFAMVAQEASLLVADIADATIEQATNGGNRGQTTVSP